MKAVVSFAEIGPDDRAELGGKGFILGRLSQAGFPVPAGFCIGVSAFVASTAGEPRLTPDAAAALRLAYEGLGEGPVAVRSSAAAEDSAAHSFAGQHLSVLAVRGAAAVEEAVGRCAGSAATAAARDYRARRGVESASASIGVVVQKMLAPRCAGVAFTAHPVSGRRDQVVIEAVAGLGDGLAGGRQTPDRYVWRRDSDTPGQVDAQVHGASPVLAESDQAVLCSLALRVEQFLGGPQDIEWAIEGGAAFILQARPITAIAAAADGQERAALRECEVARLRAVAAPGGTVWSSHNLAETLPAPTPMTWSILSGFLAGGGAMGRAYRALGYRPSRRLDREGVVDLVCGRPYTNLSRETDLYFAGFPFEHAFAALKADPSKAAYASPAVNVRRAGPGFFLRLPAYAWWMVRAESRQRRPSDSRGLG